MMTEEESEPGPEEYDQARFMDEQEVDQEEIEAYKEKQVADVIYRLMNNDYGKMEVGENHNVRLFPQELKTGNLDSQDMNFVNSAFSLIPELRSFKQRFDVETNSINFFEGSILIEINGRLSSSNSKNAKLLEEFMRNISERKYNKEEGSGKKSMFRR